MCNTFLSIFMFLIFLLHVFYTVSFKSEFTPRRRIRYNSGDLHVKRSIKGPNPNANDFEKFLLSSDTFVDKSRLINEICLVQSGSLIVITHTRLSGKSLNMDMVKRFVELNVHPNGTVIPAQNSTNYKLFAGGTVDLDDDKKKVLRQLEIFEYENVTSKFFAKFPVIFFNFHEVYGFKYQHVEQIMKANIRFMYRSHPYLKNHVRGADKETLRRYFSGNISTRDIRHSLAFLSRLLFEYFGEKAFVFVEEYDYTINELNVDFNKTATSNEKEFEEVVKLLRDFYENAFKSTTYVEKGILVGIVPFRKSVLFPRLNRVEVVTLFDEAFSRYYGFTEKELEGLIADSKLDIKIRDKVRDWYGGTYCGAGKTRYNPYSIAHFIGDIEEVLKEEIRTHNYWLENDIENLEILFDEDIFVLDEVQKDMRRLVQGESIVRATQMEVPAVYLKKNRKDVLYTMLVLRGYLNAVAPISGNGGYTLTMPNKEVQTLYIQKLESWICRRLNITDYPTLMVLMTKGKVDNFTSQLEAYVKSAEIADLRTETHFQELMQGLLCPLSSNYTIKQKAETYGHFMLPRISCKSNAAIILEYEAASKSDVLEKVAIKLLDHIDKSEAYNEELRKHHNVKFAIKIGMSFCNQSRRLFSKYRIKKLV